MAKSALEIENKNKKWYPIITFIVIVLIHVLFAFVAEHGYVFDRISSAVWIGIDVTLVTLWAIFSMVYLEQVKKGGADKLPANAPWIIVLFIVAWHGIFFHS